MYSENFKHFKAGKIHSNELMVSIGHGKITIALIGGLRERLSAVCVLTTGWEMHAIKGFCIFLPTPGNS